MISFIAESKKAGATYEDIHASLQAGARGEAPHISDQELKALSATEGEKRASLEIQALQRTIVDLGERLQRAEVAAAQYFEAEKKITRLETNLEDTHANLAKSETEKQQLQAELKEARQRIEELTREIGEQYTKGVMDILERVGQLPPKNNHAPSE